MKDQKHLEAERIMLSQLLHSSPSLKSSRLERRSATCAAMVLRLLEIESELAGSSDRCNLLPDGRGEHQ